MPQWSPERVVDEQLATSLIADAFPELAGLPLQPLGQGWDSTVWLVDGRLVFRFPRREMVVAGLRREMEVLPQLAPHLPLPIPVATYRGEPSEAFGWPWAGSAFLPGCEMPLAAPNDDDRIRHGAQLGRFLRALHHIDPDSVTFEGRPLPVDLVRRADMPFRTAGLPERFEQLERHGLWRPPAGLDRVIRRAVDLPPPQRLRIAHGDLHLRHLLVGDGGDLSGVIDWIDVCRADPAIDLPLYWGYLPPAGRDRFHEEYGEVPPDALLRARILAVFLWATIADYAQAVDVEWLRDEAVTGLTRATEDLA